VRVPLGVVGFQAREPGVHLADPGPKLTADPESARTAALAAQVVEGLDADPELLGELRQRDHGPSPCCSEDA
jgi:hypothetical protein